MYTFESRIRYSESDINGKLTLEALLDYFQDCSMFHSEDTGFGVQYLKEHKMVWVLSSWQIVADRFPSLAERVTIGTFPYDFRGCFGYRNFFMQDETGAYIAKAATLWTLLDTEQYRPVHVPEGMGERYGLEEKLPMQYAGRKIAIPEGGSTAEPIRVKGFHLDTNRHVNNGQFVRMAAEFLPEGFAVRQMRAEYKRQARLNDILYPYVAKSVSEQGEDVWTIALRDAEGASFVNVEFQGNQVDA